MIRAAVCLLLVLAGCVAGANGATCARHSDCRSGHCSSDDTCGSEGDAGLPADADAAATAIPGLDGAVDDAAEDAAVDAAVDAGVDAPDAL